MSHNSSAEKQVEENTAEGREYLHNYDISLTHLAGYLNALVDPDKVPSVEVAKAELAFALARFKFVAGEAIWRGVDVDFEEELQTLLNLAGKHGVDSETAQSTIRGMFSTITYWAGYITAILRKFPHYRNL